MVSNTILPPVFVPPVQDNEREQAPTRKQSAQSIDEREGNRKVEYIPAIPDEADIEAMANSFQREKTTGPTSAYGEVASMSAEDNRGRLLDLYV
mgnify:CR=1 FL=1